MKRCFLSLVIVFALAACNNQAGKTESVGDSLQQDPTTGQPITTAPDTVGVADTTGAVK